LAPVRVLETRFCCGPKWFVSSVCNAQIWFNNFSSPAVWV
jgi:hypothetical protein